MDRCVQKNAHRTQNITHLLTPVAYNFFPTQLSKEAPFFLMFGHQAAVKLMLLDSESPKYLGNEVGLLNIELMRKLYFDIAYKIKSHTRWKQVCKGTLPPPT